MLCNSVPKSGTFLLSRALSLLGYPNIAEKRSFLNKIRSRILNEIPSSLNYELAKRHSGKRRETVSDSILIGVTSPIPIPEKMMRKWLQSLPHGMQISGHVPYCAALDEMLQEFRYKHVVIVRDPRDVLVSFLHYVMKQGHSLSADFTVLAEPARVSLAIKGGDAPLSGRNIVGLGEAFRSILAWRHSRDCLIIRFEDLIGEKGGGSLETQLCTVKNMCDYLEIPATESLLKSVCLQVFSSDSPTFRKGMIGAWRDELPDTSLDMSAMDKELLKVFHYE